MRSVVFSAFRDELEEIAGEKTAGLKPWAAGRARSGARPMRVATLLRKEKDGSLFKKAWAESTVAFLGGKEDPGAASPPRTRGKIPSREELDTQKPKTEDGRDFAQVITSPSLAGGVGPGSSEKYQ